jgi:hypothetical protein
MKIFENVHDKMFMTSFFFLLLAINAFIYEFYALCIIDIIMFITSINYWRDPIRGFRRNLDIFTVSMLMIVHAYHAYGMNFVTLIKMGLVGILVAILYSLGLYLENSHHASIMHSLMHIVVFTGYCYMYECLLND